MGEAMTTVPELDVLDVIQCEMHDDGLKHRRVVIDRSKGTVIITTEGHIYQIINGRMARLFP